MSKNENEECQSEMCEICRVLLISGGPVRVRYVDKISEIRKYATLVEQKIAHKPTGLQKLFIQSWETPCEHLPWTFSAKPTTSLCLLIHVEQLVNILRVSCRAAQWAQGTSRLLVSTDSP